MCIVEDQCQYVTVIKSVVAARVGHQFPDSSKTESQVELVMKKQKQEYFNMFRVIESNLCRVEVCHGNKIAKSRCY